MTTDIKYDKTLENAIHWMLIRTQKLQH